MGVEVYSWGCGIGQGRGEEIGFTKVWSIDSRKEDSRNQLRSNLYVRSPLLLSMHLFITVLLILL